METARPAPESVPAAAPTASALAVAAPVVVEAVPSAEAAPAAAAAASGALAKLPAPAAPTVAPTASAATAPTPSAAPSAASAAAPEPTAPPVESPKVAEAAFSVWLSSPGKLKVGQQASVQAVVVPKGDFHTNENFPYKMKLDAAPPGLSYPTQIVRREALTQSPGRASLSIPVVATAPGPQRISGTFWFSVCNAGQCVMDNRALAVDVTVEP